MIRLTLVNKGVNRGEIRARIFGTESAADSSTEPITAAITGLTGLVVGEYVGFGRDWTAFLYATPADPGSIDRKVNGFSSSNLLNRLTEELSHGKWWQ